jgi:threonine dehydrogenase-like Zn-dependent dehydrogenase
MGRNKETLEELKHTVPNPERLATVPITGDFQAELAELKKYGGIDAFFDIGPPAAAKSSHVKSAILALRQGGKMSLMSGYHEDVPIPVSAIVHQDLSIHGKWMYDHRDLADLVKLVESGVLKLGKDAGSEVVGEYSLEQYK